MDGRWSTLIEGYQRYNWLKLNHFLGGLPSRCALCGDYTHGVVVCAGCVADLPWRPVPRLRGRHEIHATFRYAFPLVECIGRAKLGGDCGLARQIGEWMALRPVVGREAIDVVCAVPLPWRRAVLRGYNQALEMAKPVAAVLERPLLPAALARHGGTPQRGLGRERRLDNVAGSFTATARVAGQRVLVIDDVTTTGASLREAMRALRAAGAARVIAWAAAAVD